MQSIRSIGYNAYRGLTTAVPYLRQTGQMSRIGLITPEILPAVPLGMGLLFQVGQRENQGLAPSSFNEAACLTEGLLTQTMIRRAQDVFPYIPLAVGAYEVGIADGSREKVYAALKTGILFTSGYLGVTNLGSGITNALHMLESDRILSALNKPGIRTLLPKPPSPELGSLLQSLRDNAIRQRRLIEAIASEKKISPKTIAQASKELVSTQKEFLRQWPKIQQSPLSPKSLRDLQNLHRGIASYNAPYVKVLRFLNPTFGYFLGITFIGLPIAATVGKIMGAGVSGRTPEDDINLVKPLWLTPLARAASNFWPFNKFIG